MPQRRRSSTLSRRRYLLVLLASSCLSGTAHAQTPEPPASGKLTPGQPPVFLVPVERPGSAMQLQPPLNSTLQIRVARRPWLLEKLTGSSPKPSVKMNPPRPPAAIPDPPSISRIIPESHDGWVQRGRVTLRQPNYADLTQPVEFPDTSKANRSEPAKNETSQEKPSTKPQPAMTDESEGTVRPEASPVDRETKSVDSVPAHSVPTSETTAVSKTVTETAQRETATETAKSDAAADTSPETVTKKVAVESANSKSADSPNVTAPVPSNELTANPVETPATPTAKTPTDDGDASASDAIEVRELRIAPDGTLADSVDNDSVGKDAVNKDAADKGSVTTTPAAKPVTITESESPIRTNTTSSTIDPPVLDSESPSAPPVEIPAPQLDYTGRIAKPIQLTRTVSRMRNMMQQCLRYYYARPEVANERSNWGVMHSIMVYGADTKIRVGNKHYSAIAWIAGNNVCRGQRLLTLEDGSITAKSGVGLQGHQAQMLAIFSLCDVPIDYPLYANNQKFSVRDIAESEMLACRRGEELTFTLIGLAHYMDTDTVWLNADGESWSFERLIREELSQPIVGAACGGTHRLMGFAHALRKRRAEGKPITGQWKRADLYTKNFINYAYRLQNRDGSMSTDWFEGREDNDDMDRKVQTTGHMVEWLLTVTPDSGLQDRRLVNAIRYLMSSMYSERGHEWKIGPKGHALRSLAMYYDRVYQGAPAWQTRTMARSHRSSHR